MKGKHARPEPSKWLEAVKSRWVGTTMAAAAATLSPHDTGLNSPDAQLAKNLRTGASQAVVQPRRRRDELTQELERDSLDRVDKERTPTVPRPAVAQAKPDAQPRSTRLVTYQWKQAEVGEGAAGEARELVRNRAGWLPATSPAPDVAGDLADRGLPTPTAEPEPEVDDSPAL